MALKLHNCSQLGSTFSRIFSGSLATAQRFAFVTYQPRTGTRLRFLLPQQLCHRNCYPSVVIVVMNPIVEALKVATQGHSRSLFALSVSSPFPLSFSSPFARMTFGDGVENNLEKKVFLCSKKAATANTRAGKESVG